jgi:hypothetical protein
VKDIPECIEEVAGETKRPRVFGQLASAKTVELFVLPFHLIEPRESNPPDAAGWAGGGWAANPRAAASPLSDAIVEMNLRRPFDEDTIRCSSRA